MACARVITTDDTTMILMCQTSVSYTHLTTPAKLELRPGKYNIAIEKDGRRSSKEVEIQNGITSFEKIVLDR